MLNTSPRFLMRFHMAFIIRIKLLEQNKNINYKFSWKREKEIFNLNYEKMTLGIFNRQKF